MNFLEKNLFTMLITVGTAFLGIVVFDTGMLVYSHHIQKLEWKKQDDAQANAQAIETTAFRCFNDKDRSEFSSNARDLFLQGTLNRDITVILMKERWEKTGKWAKALQSQCHEDGTERR